MNYNHNFNFVSNYIIGTLGNTAKTFIYWSRKSRATKKHFIKLIIKTS